jgi:transcription antitermination factor NusG
MAWHVIRTASNQERAVAKELKEQNLVSFCPMTTVTSVKRGKLSEGYQALFRNYAFGEWDSDDPHEWHKVKSTTNVVNIIGGERPVPIEDGVIESWQRRANDRDIVTDLTDIVADLRRGYRIGSEVRLQRGQEDAMRGMVAWVDDPRQMVGIRLDLLGRQPIVVRRQHEVESTSTPLPAHNPKRRKRGGRRGTKVRQRAFANHVASLL